MTWWAEVFPVELRAWGQVSVTLLALTLVVISCWKLSIRLRQQYRLLRLQSTIKSLDGLALRAYVPYAFTPIFIASLASVDLVGLRGWMPRSTQPVWMVGNLLILSLFTLLFIYFVYLLALEPSVKRKTKSSALLLVLLWLCLTTYLVAGLWPCLGCLICLLFFQRYRASQRLGRSLETRDTV
jgi:hypothetical protein